MYHAAGFAAAVIAAGAAYFLDPRSGGRRRALLRDQFSHATHQARKFLGKAGRDARQRTQGFYEASVSRIRRGSADNRIADDPIVERIRSELGRISAHPGAIEVSCNDGDVILRGDILQDEVDSVLRGVGKVSGVGKVIDEMRVHPDPGNIPTLQGGQNFRRAPRFEYLKANWAPAPRVLAGAAGVAMMVGGLGRRSAAGAGLAAGGAALLTRSICNMPMSHLVGLRTGAADGVLVQKTLQVYAEQDEVYGCWRDFESFPAFMSHVREVRKIDATHYHWVVDGPAGVPIEWDAQITADVPGELIAWRTSKDSSVQSSGVVQFEPTNFGGTRVHVRMSYRPPANVVGHAVAKVFGKDAQRQIDTDLMRFKIFVESGGTAGTATHH